MSLRFLPVLIQTILNLLSSGLRLAARYPQEKYLEDGVAENIGMTVVSDKGTIPGYGQNSYPQTDEKAYSVLR